MRAGGDHRGIGGDLAFRRLHGAQPPAIQCEAGCRSPQQRAAIALHRIGERRHQPTRVEAMPVVRHQLAAGEVARQIGVELAQLVSVQLLPMRAVAPPDVPGARVRVPGGLRAIRDQDAVARHQPLGTGIAGERYQGLEAGGEQRLQCTRLRLDAFGCTPADAPSGKLFSDLVDLVEQGGVVEHRAPVVDGGRFREVPRGSFDDVPQCLGPRRGSTPVHRVVGRLSWTHLPASGPGGVNVDDLIYRHHSSSLHSRGAGGRGRVG